MASLHFVKRRNPSVSLLVPVLLSILVGVVVFYKDTNSVVTTRTTEPKPKPKEDTRLTTTEIFGVKIERNPSQSKLSHLGVTSWPKWGCSPSKFDWTFTANETMYLLEGKVKVYSEGYDEFFEIKGGDLVEFPKGMKVIWDVVEAVNKHYHLEK